MGIVESIKEKLIPGYKKIKDETAANIKRGEYYDSVRKAVVGLRDKKKKYLPKDFGNLKKMSADESNKAWGDFNRRPDVIADQDKISEYKNRQRIEAGTIKKSVLKKMVKPSL